MAQNWWEQDQEVAPTSPGAIALTGPDPDLPVQRAKTAAELRNAIAAAARADRAERRAEEAADRSRREWEATHNPDGSPKKAASGSGKPMRQGDVDALEKQINAYSYLKNAAESFQDDYAGNTLTGGLENTAQKMVSSIGTPGQADWWANFKTADNIIRNALFGASLTTGEKAAYAETTITPGMDPKFVRQNLARRVQIAKDVLSRRVARLHTVYNPEEVENQLGEYKDELLPSQTEMKKEKEKLNAVTGASPPQDEPTLGLATGPTRDKFDPAASAKLDRAIRAGLPYNTAMSLFPGAKPADKATYEAAVQFAKQNPRYNKSLAEVVQTVPTTAAQRLASSPLAAGIAGAANAVTAGGLDELAAGANNLLGGTQSLAEINAKKQLLAAEHPVADLAGNVVGGAGAMLGAGGALRGLGLVSKARAAANPILGAVAGDTAYGAGYGLGENNENRLLGAGLGAAGGLAGSVVGTGLAKGIGGVVNPAAERLRARGIPLTAGEVLGGGWKKAQDAAASYLPGISSRYTEGRRALNQAAFNEAGEIVGTPINATGQAGIEALDAAKSRAYSDALDPVNISLLDVGGNAEEGFADDLAALQAEIAKIPDPDARQAAMAAVQSRIKNNLTPGTGEMTGRGFQEAYRGLARVPKERGQKPYAYEVAKITRGAQDALASVLERQNPAAYGNFLKANKANRGLSVLAKAVDAAKNQEDQLFTPAQLGTAASQNAATFEGKVAAAAGRRPFNQLAVDAQQIMSSKVPDSGTATRLAVGLGLTGAGGAGGYAADSPTTGVAIPAAALALLGTRRGQALLTNALIKRTALMQRAGRNPQFGADILASAGIPLLANGE